MLVKTIGPDNANIMICGEAPGEQEDTQGIPFIGQSGQLLDKILGQAQLSKHECVLTNVAKIRPPGNQIGYYFENKAKTIPKPVLAEHIEMLRQDIISYKPNIIIALGRTALWALTGQPAISTARGFITECTLVPGVKVLPTYHPRYVTENWEMLFPVIMDIRKAVANSLTPDLVKDDRVLMASPTKGEFLDFLRHAETCDKIAVDIETTSPGSHIDILGIATSPTEAMSFTFIRNRKPRFSNPRDEVDIWAAVARVMNTVPSIMHNGTYDSAVMTLNHGIFCKEYKDDTMVAAHVCWPEVPRSLSFLSSVCINVPSWKHLQMTMPAWYNASDAANTFGVYEVIWKEILQGGHLSTYQFEMAQVEVANYLHLKGVLVDRDVRARLIAENAVATKKSGTTLAEAFGHEINFNSPKQMAQLLYRDLGLPPQYKRRKSVSEPRKVTTDKEAIIRLSRMSDNPLLALIVQHKKEVKLKSFLDTELSPTGRVHTNYNITGATMAHQKKAVVIDDDENYKSFGRWSSSKSIILPYGSGNLQNIPQIAREMYVPDEGCWFVQADYKQAEAVIVAYIIGDEKLKDMFKQSFGKSAKYCADNSLDVHKITAAAMFGIPVDEVTPTQRKVGKLLRHATSYSAGPKVVADTLGVPLKIAKQHLSQYLAASPQLQIWHKRIQEELASTRILTNLFGRKHKFLKQWGDSLFRSAYSYIPQSTVGELLNRAMVTYAEKYNDQYPLCLQLHDAMYVASQPDAINLRAAKHALYECMMIPITYKEETFCVDVDFKVGPNWKDLTETDLDT